MMESALLEVRDLSVRFATRHGEARAVEGMSFAVGRSRTLGIVGESGSGKSVSCLAIMGLLNCPPARIVRGEVVFDGMNLFELEEADWRGVRGNKIAIVFQDPMTSLNPYLTIGIQMTETLEYRERIGRRKARETAAAMLERVGLADGARCLDRYPHEFSGGMRQRICIAMALIEKPALLIADEPTTALDVTIQAQILELLRELKNELGMSMILISHDIGVVAEMSDEVIVMYAGREVERGHPSELFRNPKHPYTFGLIRSIPDIERPVENLTPILGAPPNPIETPIGCPFEPRCESRIEKCREEFPAMRSCSDTHKFFCHVDI